MMPIFAFSCGLHRVTLQCPYDSTDSYNLCSLYNFVCTFTNFCLHFYKFFKNPKTEARRHVVGSILQAPYSIDGNPAMIVWSPHGFYDNLGTKNFKIIVDLKGDRTASVRLSQGYNCTDIMGSSFRHTTASARLSCGRPVTQ